MLIAVEGIDGSGKGTQASLLQEQLLGQGLRVSLFSFPRYKETVFGKVVGEYLDGRFGSLKDVHPKLASLLYAMDRWESLELLKAHLAVSEVVICDRYVPSNQAHQCAKLETEEGDTAESGELLAWLDELEYGLIGMPTPDLVIHLDLPVESAVKLIARKKPRGYTQKTEDLHEADAVYLARVRRWYRKLVSWPRYRKRWMTVNVDFGQGDGIREVDQVAADVWEAASDVLKLKRTK